MSIPKIARTSVQKQLDDLHAVARLSFGHVLFGTIALVRSKRRLPASFHPETVLVTPTCGKGCNNVQGELGLPSDRHTINITMNLRESVATGRWASTETWLAIFANSKT